MPTSCSNRSTECKCQSCLFFFSSILFNMLTFVAAVCFLRAVSAARDGTSFEWKYVPVISVKLLEMLEEMLFRSPFPTLKVFESRVDAAFQRAFEQSIQVDYKETHRVRRAFLDAVLKEAAACSASGDNAAQESADSLVAEIMGNSDQPPLPGPAAAPPAQPPSQAALSAPGQPSSSSVEQEATPATT